MARPRLSQEERKAKQRRGVIRWHRRVDRQVQELFDWFHNLNGHDTSGPKENPDAAEFTREYYNHYGEYLPLIYARAHTEFGEQYGSDINWEDAGCGEFRPRGKPTGCGGDAAIDLQVEKAMELYDAHIASLTPEQLIALEAQADSNESKAKNDYDFEIEPPF